VRRAFAKANGKWVAERTRFRQPDEKKSMNLLKATSPEHLRLTCLLKNQQTSPALASASHEVGVGPNV